MTRWPFHLINMICPIDLRKQRYLIVKQLYVLVFSLSSHWWWSLNYALGISLPGILCSFWPFAVEAFHLPLKLKRLKISFIVKTVIVPCVSSVRPLIVVFMYEQGFFLAMHTVHLLTSPSWLLANETQQVQTPKWQQANLLALYRSWIRE